MLFHISCSMKKKKNINQTQTQMQMVHRSQTENKNDQNIVHYTHIIPLHRNKKIYRFS